MPQNILIEVPRWIALYGLISLGAFSTVLLCAVLAARACDRRGWW